MAEVQTPDSLTKPSSTAPHDLDLTGFLDEVLGVFEHRKHPFILIEECALGWMGTAVTPKEDVDILIGSQQLDNIIDDLITTGRWEKVAPSLERQSSAAHKDIPRLRRQFEGTDHELCLSFWTEQKYQLEVDGAKVEVPDCCSQNMPLLEERFDPKEPRGPRLLSPEGVRFVSQVSARSKDCRVPIFVPTIPRFLDADISRWRHDMENLPPAQQYWGGKSQHTTYLIRYLFLDQEKLLERILLELSERNRNELRKMCETYVRKPVFGQGPTEEQLRRRKANRDALRARNAALPR
ncbi:hypothetical protein OEA41_002919 [Lepraria neglecta]|uniref:Uncharacterized protein n=1 Tax=Lepraria neglecta TaxID=209136 RepID=A0AAD9Z3V4_9LECA|nr:hypothetical protein OEA41_002919 [Lepraria neglecta]